VRVDGIRLFRQGEEFFFEFETYSHVGTVSRDSCKNIGSLGKIPRTVHYSALSTPLPTLEACKLFFERHELGGEPDAASSSFSHSWRKNAVKILMDAREYPVLQQKDPQHRHLGCDTSPESVYWEKRIIQYVWMHNACEQDIKQFYAFIKLHPFSEEETKHCGERVVHSDLQPTPHSGVYLKTRECYPHYEDKACFCFRTCVRNPDTEQNMAITVFVPEYQALQLICTRSQKDYAVFAPFILGNKFLEEHGAEHEIPFLCHAQLSLSDTMCLSKKVVCDIPSIHGALSYVATGSLYDMPLHVMRYGLPVTSDFAYQFVIGELEKEFIERQGEGRDDTPDSDNADEVQEAQRLQNMFRWARKRFNAYGSVHIPLCYTGSFINVSEQCDFMFQNDQQAFERFWFFAIPNFVVTKDALKETRGIPDSHERRAVEVCHALRGDNEIARKLKLCVPRGTRKIKMMIFGVEKSTYGNTYENIAPPPTARELDDLRVSQGEFLERLSSRRQKRRIGDVTSVGEASTSKRARIDE
jgi:hypothetical protein